MYAGENRTKTLALRNEPCENCRFLGNSQSKDSIYNKGLGPGKASDLHRAFLLHHPTTMRSAILSKRADK